MNKRLGDTPALSKVGVSCHFTRLKNYALQTVQFYFRSFAEEDGCPQSAFGRDLVLVDQSLWNAARDEEVGRAAAVNEQDEVVWIEGWDLRWRERTFPCEY